MSGDSNEVDFQDNFVKRERRKKIETKKKINALKAALPVYTLKDIREYRLPYFQAVLLELEEEGFIHSLEYIRQLFHHEQQQKIEFENKSGFWSRPFLVDSPTELRHLKDALVAAEKAHYDEDYSKEVEEILKVAIYFSFNTSEDWWWLGEELLIQSVDRCIAYPTNNNQKMEAWCRYVYGKFLIENAGEFDAAEIELTQARTLSSGKSWNMKQFFPELKDNLYMNISRLLYACAIRQAKFWAKSNKEKAAQLALKAKKRASEACYRDGETEALLLKGYCLLEGKDIRQAISNFNKAFYIQAKLQSPVGMCEARVQLSKAYLVFGNPHLALQNLILLKDTAEKNNLPFYLAQAYRHLGEYYLNKGEAHKATPLLADALEIFCELKSVDEGEQVRNLQAVSAGLELMAGYTNLLKSTDKHNDNWFENVMKLVRWKDSREEFWNSADLIGSLGEDNDDEETDSLEERLGLGSRTKLGRAFLTDDDGEVKSDKKDLPKISALLIIKKSSTKAVVIKTEDSDSQVTVSTDEGSAESRATSETPSDVPVEVKAMGIIQEYVDQIHTVEKKKKRFGGDLAAKKSTITSKFVL